MNKGNETMPVSSEDNGHLKIEAHMNTNVDIKPPSKHSVRNMWNTLATALKKISKQTA